MDVLNQLFSTFKVKAEVFHNGQYCGNWAVDTSGSSYISFHIVSHGRCYLRVQDSHKTIELSQGDIVLFPQDARHHITSDSSFKQTVNQTVSLPFATGRQANSTGLVCGYFVHQHPLINSIINYLPDHIVLRFAADNPTSIMLMLQALIKESVREATSSKLILEKMAETILAMVFRDHLPTEHGILAALLHPKLATAIKAVHAAPANKWSVEQLAELCYMSRAAFAELFKQVVKLSPMEYVTQWRLSLAYRMLADEKVTVLHAALAAGYDNDASFAKAFKRVLGVSPGAVRAGKSPAAKTIS